MLRVCRPCNQYTLKLLCPKCEKPTVNPYGSTSTYQHKSGKTFAELAREYPPEREGLDREVPSELSMESEAPTHKHGTDRPCAFRVGLNQGVVLSRINEGWSCLYTDGLVNCVGVAMTGNDNRYLSHVAGEVINAPDQMTKLLKRFMQEWSGGVLAVNVVWTSINRSQGLGAQIFSALRKVCDQTVGCQSNCVEVSRDGTVAINGKARQVESKDVCGTITATNLVVARHDVVSTTILDGDFVDYCRACNK